METDKDMSIVIEYISESGLDVVKDRINSQKDEIVVRNRINDYLQRQEKLILPKRKRLISKGCCK